MTEQKTSGTKAELIEEIQTRGAWSAYQASLAVCADPKAAPNARAQAASNILRAGGYFASRADDGTLKEPSEMSAAEIEATVADLQRQRRPVKETVFD